MSEAVKLSLVGTSCIGKSSLLALCQEHIPEAVVVSEAAREYFTGHPEVKDRFTVRAQGEVQALALRKEKEAHAQAVKLGKTAIICDRSVLDAPVYVSSQGDTHGAEELLARVQLWLPTYNKIFLLDPSDIPFAQDDVRAEDEATRQVFHETFLTFFAEHNISYELLSGNIDERFGKVSDFISTA